MKSKQTSQAMAPHPPGSATESRSAAVLQPQQAVMLALLALPH